MRSSAVWLYFKKIENRRVKCSSCNKILKYNNSTSALAAHLKAVHKIDTLKGNRRAMRQRKPVVTEQVATREMIGSDNCFLCSKPSGNEAQPFRSIASCTVPASGKPIQTVLQHLANCIKTKLVFQGDACICEECTDELVEYDNVMINLLTFQKRLTERLQIVLSGELKLEQEEFDVSVTETMIVEENEQLEDAFNPELDAKEELIEIEEAILESVKPEQDDIEGMDQQCDKPFDYEDEEDGNEENDDDSYDDCYFEDKRVSHLECVICSASFLSKAQLHTHISEAHNNKTFVCTICGAIRRDEEYLALHMNIHEGKTENECRYCDKRFSRPVNTLRHMRKHWDKKEYQCEKCGERFSLDNMLYNHRMRHEAEENPLICSICHQSFRSRKTYNHHMLTHQENRPRHHCTLCTKSFTERYTLKMHMKTHNVELLPLRSGGTPTKVISDAEQKETEDAVSALMSKFDRSAKDYTCVICSKQFENKDSLEKHLQTDHDVILESSDRSQ